MVTQLLCAGVSSRSNDENERQKIADNKLRRDDDCSPRRGNGCFAVSGGGREKAKHGSGLAVREIHLSLQPAQFPELLMFQLSHPLVVLSSLIEYLRYPSMLHLRLKLSHLGQLQ